jgi:hypothetical protein
MRRSTIVQRGKTIVQRVETTMPRQQVHRLLRRVDRDGWLRDAIAWFADPIACAPEPITRSADPIVRSNRSARVERTRRTHASWIVRCDQTIRRVGLRIASTERGTRPHERNGSHRHRALSKDTGMQKRRAASWRRCTRPITDPHAHGGKCHPNYRMLWPRLCQRHPTSSDRQRNRNMK